MPDSQPQALPPLTVPVYYILLALTDGERHGYGIITEVEDRTGGAVRLRTGTLYNAVRRMLEQGLIEESEERPDPAMDDERRRYYRITASGREVLKADAARLAQMVSLARDKNVYADDGGAA